MKLGVYLEQMGWNPSLFARKCGLSHTCIHNIIYELHNVSLQTAIAINNATEGMVSFDDMAFLPAKQGFWPALKKGRYKKTKQEPNEQKV